MCSWRHFVPVLLPLSCFLHGCEDNSVPTVPPTPAPTSAPLPPTLAPTIAPSPTATPAPSASSPSQAPTVESMLMSAREWEHFELLNGLRAQGFTCPGGQSYAPNPVPVQLDCRLWRASQLHSQDMADNNYFSHDSQDGRSPWDRAQEQGIQASGENIAAGAGSAEAVLEMWKGSGGHCSGMMNPNVKLFGVGHGYNEASNYKNYWTQMFNMAEVPVDKSCYPAGADTLRVRTHGLGNTHVNDFLDVVLPPPAVEASFDQLMSP